MWCNVNLIYGTNESFALTEDWGFSISCLITSCHQSHTINVLRLALEQALSLWEYGCWLGFVAAAWYTLLLPTSTTTPVFFCLDLLQFFLFCTLLVVNFVHRNVQIHFKRIREKLKSGIKLFWLNICFYYPFICRCLYCVLHAIHINLFIKLCVYLVGSWKGMLGVKQKKYTSHW